MKVRSEREYPFATDVDQVWAAMTSVGEFQRWWPWLERLDGSAIEVGQTWRCVVRTPFRYSMAFVVTFEEVVPGCRVHAAIDGDVRGGAQVAMSTTADGCTVRVGSQLEPVAILPRAVGAVLPPVARWGHRHLLDTGADQFGRHLPRRPA